jgi:hypothetical protein
MSYGRLFMDGEWCGCGRKRPAEILTGQLQLQLCGELIGREKFYFFAVNAAK